jgi:hypothetical protein
MEKSQKLGETSHIGLVKKLFVSDSPESQARPSEIHRSSAGQEGFGPSPNIEHACRLLALHKAMDSVTSGEDRALMPGFKSGARELQRCCHSLATVWALGKEEQKLSHRAPLASTLCALLTERKYISRCLPINLAYSQVRQTPYIHEGRSLFSVGSWVSPTA